MNKTKIDWADYTWNPITGCRHNCSYCYARKQSQRFAGDVRLNKGHTELYRMQEDIYVLDSPFPAPNSRTLAFPFGFEPTYHRYRLDFPEKKKTPANIFVGSMSDIFGSWIPNEIICEIFAACEKGPHNNYLFLTKNYSRYAELHEKGLLPVRDNMWYGISVTDNSGAWRGEFLPLQGYNIFVSIEPMLEEIEPYNIPSAHWIIIGALTNSRKKIVPQKEWIDRIVTAADGKIPIFMKGSLKDVMGADLTQQYPDKLIITEHYSQKSKAKLWDHCSICSKYLPMKDMTALLYRSARGESAKKLGYACNECFGKLKQELNQNCKKGSKEDE